MRTKKIDPPDRPKDGRRVAPLDELRARTWFRFVSESSGCESYYGLSQLTDFGRADQWRNYSRGGQPNDATLEAAERVVPGSTSVYLFGPGSLKLWAALSYEDPYHLQLIADHSVSCDAIIAKFKLQVIHYPELLENDNWWAWPKGHPLEDHLLDVYGSVHCELDPPLANEVNEFLWNWYWEILLGVRRKLEMELMGQLVPGPYSVEQLEKMERELQFEELALGTVGMKGIRPPKLR
jgi:hypothetical protein